RARGAQWEDARSALGDASFAADASRSDRLSALALARLTWVSGWALSRYDEGMLLSRAAQARIDRIGGDPEAHARLEASIGSTQFRHGDFASAAEHHRAAVDAFTALGAPAQLDAADALNALGLSTDRLGRPDDAKAALALSQRALAIREKAQGATSPALASSLRGEGLSLVALGQSANAVPALERALAVSGAKADPIELALTRLALAQALGSGE